MLDINNKNRVIILKNQSFILSENRKKFNKDFKLGKLSESYRIYPISCCPVIPT